MNIIQQYEAEQIARLTADRPVPDFRPGDTLRVAVKVVDASVRACRTSKACASRVRTRA